VPTSVLTVVFLVSGAAGLVFETLWFAQAGLGFGNGIVASSLVLAGFMAGMALGGAIAARFEGRIGNAFRAYGALEGGVAVTGVLLTYVLPGTHRMLSPLTAMLPESSPLLSVLRLATAFALLCVPSTAIGMTLPVLARALAARDANFGRVLGLLYGVNTAGAVLGTLATEHFLLRSLGVHGSAWVAGAMDASAGAVAWYFSRDHRPPDTATGVVVSGARRSPQAPWLASAFVSGFVLLALEVIWLRFLSMFLNDTPLAFATILALVLTGVASGSLVVSRIAAKREGVERFAPFVAYGAGLLALFGYLLYPRFLEKYATSQQDGMTVFLVALPLVLPACFASGALYTVLGAGLRRVTASHGAAAGRLSLVNTTGSALGSLAAGFVLLPRLGMERSLFLAIVAYGVVGVTLSLATAEKRAVAAGAAAAFAVCLLLFPFGFVQKDYLAASIGRWMRPGDEVRAVREGQSSTIVHVVHRAHGAPLFDQVATNSYSMTVNDFVGRRYMKLFVWLPSALHAHLKRAMVVGYGIGNTVEALTDDPELEHIDVADVSRDLLEVSRGVVTRPGKRPLDDPRVTVHVEDGRYFLTASKESYDLITGEPPPPVVAGVVPLYTEEYFSLLRDRLAPGGMVSYWLPMMNISEGTARSIIAAFCDAFSDCSLWQGAGENFMLLGTRDSSGPVTEERFTRLFRDGNSTTERRALGIETPGQLGALFIGDSAYLQSVIDGAPPLIDDMPRRIQQEGTAETRAALVERFADTKSARERFGGSAFVASHFPGSIRRASLPQFENQRLLDDLMARKPQWSRSTRVLHHVLTATPLRLPVLLILKSSPDVQRALDALPAADRDRPEWLPHRVAGLLAERDWQGAAALLEKGPPGNDALPDLRDYVAFGARKSAEAAGPP
jgi:spermidine synthase